MHNIFLTNLCNNHCPYCFAKGKLKHTRQECGEEDFLSVEDAKIVSEFFEAEKLISFLGGEPTLHPHFETITNIFLEKGYEIFLFTNGLFSEDILGFLRGKKTIYYIFNINGPKSYEERKWETILSNLRGLRENVNSLAITLYGLDQDCDYILRLAREFDIKAVKIGVAAPSDDNSNKRVPLYEKNRLARKLVDLVLRLSEAGIVSYGECEKLKPCMMDDESKEKMRSSKWKGSLWINKQCRTGGNIDIGPDLMVWRCYSFPHSLGKKLTDFRNSEELREYSRKKYENLFFHTYYMDKCYDCEYALDRACEGGCLVRIYRKYNKREVYFYHRYYAKLINHVKGKNVVFLYKNPMETELANLRQNDLWEKNGFESNGDCDYLITDFLHNFNPFKVRLFDVRENVHTFPSRMNVYGVLVRTKKKPGISRWRKTKGIVKEDFMSEPFLIYETDFRRMCWYKEEITISKTEQDALVIFYSAYNENDEEIFCSFWNEGFVWLYPTSKDEQMRMKDRVVIVEAAKKHSGLHPD